MNKDLFSLAEIFQDHMVIQRDKDIKVFGNAASGKTVKASVSDNSKIIVSGEAITSEDGRFIITMAPVSAGIGFSLTVTCDSQTIMLNDISFGDIWLAGGQSNMEFYLMYEKHWEATKSLPKNSNIHMYNVPQRAFDGHTTHNFRGGYGFWFTDSDIQSLGLFSAPGYSFAREIQATADVPVAIIGCNWGGSTASAWVPEHILKKAPLNRYFEEYEEQKPDVSDEALRQMSLEGWAYEDDLTHWKSFEPLLYGRDRSFQLKYMTDHDGEPAVPMGPYNMNRPSGLYHTMLETLIPFQIKGVIWYQGESDSGNRAETYDILMSELINDWRKEWNDDFPFLMVQLAPFGKWLICGNDDYHIVRAKQEKVCDTMKDVYMASIMDIGSYYDIHPKEKMEVGRRLGLLARGHVYGENILCDAPRAKKATYKDGKITVYLDNADGLSIDGETDILITDDIDSVRPQKIEIIDNNIVITTPTGFNEPKSVSIGWDDYAIISIHNASGLSIAPCQIMIY